MARVSSVVFIEFSVRAMQFSYRLLFILFLFQINCHIFRARSAMWFVRLINFCHCIDRCASIWLMVGWTDWFGLYFFHLSFRWYFMLILFRLVETTWLKRPTGCPGTRGGRLSAAKRPSPARLCWRPWTKCSRRRVPPISPCVYPCRMCTRLAVSERCPWAESRPESSSPAW